MRPGIRRSLDGTGHTPIPGTNLTMTADWRHFKNGREYDFPPRDADWFPCWRLIRNCGIKGQAEFLPKMDAADDDILPAHELREIRTAEGR